MLAKQRGLKRASGLKRGRERGPFTQRSACLSAAQQPMSQYNSSHFVVSQLEDGWMLQSEHVTKVQNGDWILDREELEELAELLQTALSRS